MNKEKAMKVITASLNNPQTLFKIGKSAVVLKNFEGKYYVEHRTERFILSTHDMPRDEMVTYLQTMNSVQG